MDRWTTLFLLAACAAPAPERTRGPTDTQAGVPALGVPSLGLPALGLRAGGLRGDLDHETGALGVRVHWPGAQTQTLPVTTVAVDVSLVYPPSLTPTRQGTLRRAPGVSPEIKFEAIPAGRAVVSGLAKDNLGNEVASGSTPVEIRPNEWSFVRLALIPKDRPVISSFAPQNGLPGQQIRVVGANFGRSKGLPIFLYFGRDRTPARVVDRQDDTQLLCQVPDGAGSGPLLVDVGGATGSSTAEFSVIASLSLSAAAADTFAPAGAVDLAVTALDATGRRIAQPIFPFAATKPNCPQGPCNSDDRLQFDGERGRFVAGLDAGQVTVVVGSGSLVARAAIALHAFGRVDLPTDFGKLGPVPMPDFNISTASRVNLGRRLFMDPGLSRGKDIACAACHVPELGFNDRRPFARAGGRDSLRNAPSLLDVAYYLRLGWIGRYATLEKQILADLQDPQGQNADLGALLTYLQASASYVTAMQEAYAAAPAIDLVPKALAAYVRTLTTPASVSSCDRWLGGDEAALTPVAKRGLAIFVGHGRCVTCHNGPTLSDNRFHNLALVSAGLPDPGRFAITGDPRDQLAFRTPTMRNVALSAPYFHDGSRPTLRDAITYFESFDPFSPNLSTDLKTSPMSAAEHAAVAEFLGSLTATPSP